ncbi:MAG: hypothetical protein EOM50_08570 [Erysipelotrichia bacterium]|nr:hypothetical protein [Erysipelotrichia bacterium]
MQQQLVNVKELKTLLNKYSDQEMFTAQSWKAYEAIKNEILKTTMKTGSESDVKEAIQKLQEVEKTLVFKDDFDTFMKYKKTLEALDKKDFTVDSYAVLTQTIQLVNEAKDTQMKPKEYLQQLKTASDQLVSLAGLNAKINEFKQLKAENYTRSSYQYVNEVMKVAEKVKQNGSKAMVSEEVVKISEAMKRLAFNAKDLLSYRESITLFNRTDVSKDSYTDYKEKYDALFALEVGNTDIDTFEKAKSDFILATQKLVYVYADYSKVDALIASIPNDLNVYTFDSVETLKAALRQVERGKLLSMQSEVDAYEQSLQKSIKQLKLKEKALVVAGDTTNAQGLMIVLLLSAIAMFIVVKKKKVSVKD